MNADLPIQLVVILCINTIISLFNIKRSSFSYPIGSIKVHLSFVTQFSFHSLWIPVNFSWVQVTKIEKKPKKPRYIQMWMSFKDLVLKFLQKALGIRLRRIGKCLCILFIFFFGRLISVKNILSLKTDFKGIVFIVWLFVSFTFFILSSFMIC